MKLSSWEVGRNLLYNNTVNKRVSIKKTTLKREEPVWITFDDWLWSGVVLSLCDAEVCRAITLVSTLPVIPF
jgi:hypothetical protein